MPDWLVAQQADLAIADTELMMTVWRIRELSQGTSLNMNTQAMKQLQDTVKAAISNAEYRKNAQAMQQDMQRRRLQTRRGRNIGLRAAPAQDARRRRESGELCKTDSGLVTHLVKRSRISPRNMIYPLNRVPTLELDEILDVGRLGIQAVRRIRAGYH